MSVFQAYYSQLRESKEKFIQKKMNGQQINTPNEAKAIDDPD